MKNLVNRWKRLDVISLLDSICLLCFSNECLKNSGSYFYSYHSNLPITEWATKETKSLSHKVCRKNWKSQKNPLFILYIIQQITFINTLNRVFPNSARIVLVEYITGSVVELYKFLLKIWQRFDKVLAKYYQTNGKYWSNIWQSFI